MNVLQAIILSVIEGLTEFLPISSTGHMIIAEAMMGLSNNNFAKLFIIVIQLGAVLAVVVLYRKRFFSFADFKTTRDFYLKLLVAFLPAVVAGLLFEKLVDSLLGNVQVVAVTLFLGGIFLVFADKIFKRNETEPEKPITYWMALKIGLFQVLAMVPGTSRSAATIVGGLTQKLNRKQAAEFSFFLAVPTMFAATTKDIYDNRNLLSEFKVIALLGGSVMAFAVAMIAIRTFIGYLNNHGFKIFGYYRIIIGGVILILLAMGYTLTLAK
ncbi:MAG: undecaprenyl-diphosphate phosphatase [Chitinophagales bacterium]